MAEIGTEGVKVVSPKFAPRPTGWVVFLRTFLPWQLFRFVWINLKMIHMIRLSHGGVLPGERKH
ncbi:MAG: hypothetical protein H6810_11135 [Phycisphaeraceae bacterium]|nr:MAG: hypothetical protein H6810_11135 [Phycisphaeraceae bacterium]